MLDVRGVTKQFGSLVAVDDVSMQVAAGELRAIIGPNGAGKTTFFNMISGFFPPTAGEIVFDGDVVTRLSVTGRVALRHGAHVPDHRDLPRTDGAREHPHRRRKRARAAAALLARARIAPPRSTRGIDEALEQTGLTGKADRLVGELSHGDQRAAEIATALTLKPRLLLLDEPTAGMGEHETYAVANLIRRLHKNSAYTIVLIEHDMRVVFNLADRITVLAEGKLLAEGTPAEIADNPVVQEAYLGKAE